MTTFHPTNESYMASVIDNNIVMWDVSDNGVKIVCTAVLDGKGKEIYVAKLYYSKRVYKFQKNIFNFFQKFL